MFTMYGEQLFYGQFERDFYNFLQRRKREQNEELEQLTAEAKLKFTLKEIEVIIEKSKIYTAKNEVILREIKKIEESGTVGKLIKSETFIYKLQDVVSGTRAEEIRGEIDNLYRETRKPKLSTTVVGEQYGEFDVNPLTVPTEIGHGNDTRLLKPGPEFAQHLDMLLRRSPQLQQTTVAPGNPVYSESQGSGIVQPYPWVMVMDEVSEFEKEGKVSHLDEGFKNQLIKVLRNPPKPTTHLHLPELEIKSDRELGHWYTNIGAREIHRDNLDKAILAFNDALAIGYGEDDKELQWKAHDGLGTVASKQNETESATKHFQAAINLLDMEISTVEVTALRDHIEEKLLRMVRNVP